MAFPVVMRPGAWNTLLGLPEPARSEAIDLLCRLVDGPTAVEEASDDGFGKYSVELTGRYYVAFGLEAGGRPDLEEAPEGPYVYVWEPVPWEEPPEWP